MNNLAKLKNHKKEIERLKQASSGSREFSVWRRQTEESLKTFFGEDSAEVQEFNAIYYTPVFLTCRMGDEAFEEAFRQGLEEARRVLSGICSRLSNRGD